MVDRPTVAVGILVLDGDRVLLIQRAKPPAAGKWSVPGGKVELGESLEEAALRELREETGLSCTLGPIVEVLDRVIRNGDEIEFHYVILDFVGKDPVGELRASSDSLDARFVAISDLSSYQLTDGLTEVIERARQMKDGPVRVHENFRSGSRS
jgi:mutator protein MutT